MSLRQRLSVIVNSPIKLDEETEKELQKFTWKVISVSSVEIQIKLEFEFPEVVSAEKGNL